MIRRWGVFGLLLLSFAAHAEKPKWDVGAEGVLGLTLGRLGAYWVNELYGVVSTKADTTVTGGGAVLYEVLAPEGRRPELLLGVADDLAWSAGPDSFFNRVGAVGSLRAPKWGGWRDVTVQLCFSLYTHERNLHGTPSVALALSAVTPHFLGQ